VGRSGGRFEWPGRGTRGLPGSGAAEAIGEDRKASFRKALARQQPCAPCAISIRELQLAALELREQGKLTVRERLDLLLDAGSFIEDGLFANVLAEDLPADGVVTGLGRVEGRPVAVMANDPTVKAGSWGARTVEKIVRIQETAGRLKVPLFYTPYPEHPVDRPVSCPDSHSAQREGGLW
jgi:Carboxyl transferase domain